MENADITAKLERQRAFWKRENHDRPVIGFTGGYFAGETIQMVDKTEGRLYPKDVNIERILEFNEGEYDAWRNCTGDLFWSANPLFKFRWLAAALGAQIMAGGESVWVEPFLENYGRVDDLVIREDNPWVQTLWALTDAMVEQAGERYPVAAIELMSPLTALADFRGNTELAFDLYDHPHEVKRAMERLTECWGHMVTAQYQRLKPWFGGFIGAQRLIWAPGRIMEFNEDPAFMFKLEFHEEFVIPSHKKLLTYIEYPYIHMHSTQLHTLDRLLDLEELPAIELTPDYGQSISDMIPSIQKAQTRKPTIVHAFFTLEEMRMIVDQVPPEGLCVISRADTPEEARRLQDAMLG